MNVDSDINLDLLPKPDRVYWENFLRTNQMKQYHYKSNLSMHKITFVAVVFINLHVILFGKNSKCCFLCLIWFVFLFSLRVWLQFPWYWFRAELQVGVSVSISITRVFVINFALFQVLEDLFDCFVGNKLQLRRHLGLWSWYRHWIWHSEISYQLQKGSSRY